MQGLAPVEFVVGDSIEYLSAIDERYDLIFLDGDHAAANVYRELPLALLRLNQEGVIVLHDYYPQGRRCCPTGNLKWDRISPCADSCQKGLPFACCRWATCHGGSGHKPLRWCSAPNPRCLNTQASPARRDEELAELRIQTPGIGGGLGERNISSRGIGKTVLLVEFDMITREAD